MESEVLCLPKISEVANYHSTNTKDSTIPNRVGTLWPEDYRGIPHSIARSGLFRISLQPGSNDNVRPKYSGIIPSTREFEIEYTGEILDKSDLDVLLEIFHLIRDQLELISHNYVVKISTRKFLRLLDRCDSSGKNGSLLYHSIRRLSQCNVVIKNDEYMFAGNFIDRLSMDLKSRNYEIRVNPRIATLFIKGRWSRFELAQRRKLSKKPIASWLHRFYSSFAERSNFQFDLKNIRSLTMSQDTSLAGFRRNVGIALGVLKSEASWIGRIDESDILMVTR
jgi:hypothetical protein